MAFRMSKIPFTKNNKDIQIFNTLLSKVPMTKQMKMPAIMFIIPIKIPSSSTTGTKF